MKRLTICCVMAAIFFSYRPSVADKFLPEEKPSVVKKIVGAVANSAPKIRRVFPKRAWGPEQTIGKPDTPGAGDIQTAWASQTPDGKNEWLELEYSDAIEPAVVIVHENYNPGAVYKITGYSKSGMEAELWSGEDPTAIGKPRGVSEIKIGVKFKTKRIRVYLKSKEVPGWNEIDAVGIKNADGAVQWAIQARASSSFASTNEPDNGIPIAEAPRVPRRVLVDEPIGLVDEPVIDEARKLEQEIKTLRNAEAVIRKKLDDLNAQSDAVSKAIEERVEKLKALEKKSEKRKDE